MRIIDIGRGRRIGVRIKGAGPVVVLESSGAGYGLDGWLGFDEKLASFAMVVTYDRLGVGASGPAPRDYPLPADHAANLADLLEALGLPQPVIVVGWSMGGLIAQQFAMMYPEKVSALLLMDPSAFGRSRPHVPRLVEWVSRIVGSISSRRMAARIRAGVYSDTRARMKYVEAHRRKLAPRFPDDLIERAADLLLSDAAVHENSIELMNKLPHIHAVFAKTATTLKLPRVPLIVILGGYIGEKPRLLLTRIYQRFQAEYSERTRELGGEVRFLPDVSHQIPFEAPDECLDAIRELIAHTGAVAAESGK